jgi:hypothetical protein
MADRHTARMRCKRAQVDWILGENVSPWFGHRYDQSIDGGSASGARSKRRSTTGQRDWQRLCDIAGLQEPVRARIATGVTGQAFDEDH